MKKLKPYLFILLPIFILILLRIPSLFESYWYGDEGIYAAVAEELTRGKALYAQTWDHKPPLIFWVFYPAALIGWDLGFILLRAANILLGALTIIGVNKILEKKKFSDFSRFLSLIFLSIFLGSTILEGNVVNAEVIFIVFNIFFFLFLLSRKYLFIAGLLAFLSLVTKVPGFVEVALVSIPFAVIWLREKGVKYLFVSSLKIATGFLIPMILLVAYFLYQGLIGDFYYANLAFNRIYSLHQANFSQILGNQLPNTYLQASSVILVLFFSTIFYIKDKFSSFTYLVVNLLAASFFASLLSAKNYGHYFIQILPAATLLLAMFLQKVKSVNLQKILTTVLFLLLLSPLFYTLKLGGEIPLYAKPTEYYGSFFKGFILQDDVARNDFWWGEGEGVKKTKDFSNYLDENYQEDTPLYIYTDKPWVIAIADQKYTNKYVVWFHLAYRQEHLQEDIKNLRKAEVVIIDKDINLLEPVSEIVQSEFESAGTYRNFEFFERI